MNTKGISHDDSIAQSLNHMLDVLTTLTRTHLRLQHPHHRRIATTTSSSSLRSPISLPFSLHRILTAPPLLLGLHLVDFDTAVARQSTTAIYLNSTRVVVSSSSSSSSHDSGRRRRFIVVIIFSFIL
ncbi:hypothetical protein PIB30_066594 [Stylosanthes scabra]|uniref:Uncharacterized protein n=1 Tax=Stylosanthes scabra TaxID=79078 RepID=A0ABU6XK79_9FABA|nr:hypothetical protein [Stylosanthes scabra]